MSYGKLDFKSELCIKNKGMEEPFTKELVMDD